MDDWTSGSKGWIVWVSLAIMLADSVVSLGWLILRPLATHGPQWYNEAREHLRNGNLWSSFGFQQSQRGSYTALESSEHFDSHHLRSRSRSVSNPKRRLEQDEFPEVDAPPAHLVSNRVVLALLILSIAFCVIAIRVVFGALVPFYAIFLSIVLALLLSVMGVRASGETDLNPVSGISSLRSLSSLSSYPTRIRTLSLLICWPGRYPSQGPCKRVI